MDDDKISILVCVFLFYTCPVKGRTTTGRMALHAHFF